MQPLSQSQRRFLQEATDRYSGSLPGSPAEEYLATRGLTHPSIAEQMSRFQLGYVAEPLPGHEMHRGSLAIPYRRLLLESGEWTVVSIRFRCIQNHEHQGHGKYMTVAGDRPRLYNTPTLLTDRDTIAICEGEIDAITTQLCGIPAVGVPGAESWQRHYRELFLGFARVVVLADGDEAGHRFADTVAKTIPRSQVISCPPGSDVNDLVVNQGRQALLERIKPT